MVIARVTIKACLLCAGLLAATTAAAGDYEDLVAAEQRFAADAATRGTRAAFLEALAPDGLVYGPGPTHGKRSWEARPDDGSRLEWPQGRDNTAGKRPSVGAHSVEQDHGAGDPYILPRHEELGESGKQRRHLDQKSQRDAADHHPC